MIVIKEKTETCGKRIEKALTLRNMKQSDLCKLVGIPKSSLSLYLKDAYEPKKDRLFKMAIALNVSEGWLMGFDVPMERDGADTSTSIQAKPNDNEEIMLSLFRLIPEKQQKFLIQMIQEILRQK